MVNRQSRNEQIYPAGGVDGFKKTPFISLRAQGLNDYRNYVPVGGAIFGPAETGAIGRRDCSFV
jgi:hypothetical protein